MMSENDKYQHFVRFGWLSIIALCVPFFFILEGIFWWELLIIIGVWIGICFFIRNVSINFLWDVTEEEDKPSDKQRRYLNGILSVIVLLLLIITYKFLSLDL